MRVLVAGATGRLGRELVRQLKESGYFVRTLGRDAAKLRSVCPSADESVALDAFKLPELLRACEGMEHLVSCVGASVIPTVWHGRSSFTQIDLSANLNLIEAAEAQGVRRFIYISVFTDGKLQENDFVRGHEQVVERLRASTLEYGVARPTGFFSSLVQIMREPSMGLLPQYRSGEARTNPIHEADLAAFCIDLLQAEDRRQERNVGGPEVLTRRQIADLVVRNGNRGGPVFQVPVGALRMGSLALSPFNRRVSQLMAFIADVLSSDFVAPQYGVRTLAQYLGTERGSTHGPNAHTGSTSA